MKSTLAFLFLIVTQHLFGQIDYARHNQLLMDGRRAFENHQFKESLENYEEAFEINGANRQVEYLQAAASAAQLSRQPSCKKWLVEAIQVENIDMGFLENFSNHEVYKNSVENIRPDVEKFKESFYRNKENLTVYFKICELISRDQVVRSLNDYYHNISDVEKELAFEKISDPAIDKESDDYKKYKAILFPSLPEELKSFSHQSMRTADSLNIRELIEITEEHGWQDDAWILLWHQRGSFGQENWVWNYFKEIIDNEIKSGSVAPHYWAVFEDFKSIMDSGESIYGYHPGKVNALEVNKMRYKIGLPALLESEIEARNANPYAGIQY